MIGAMFPNVPKLEMFARGQCITGWDFWGNEIDDADRGGDRISAQLSLLLETAEAP